MCTVRSDTSSNKPKLLAIVGCTASGKTALSIALAHRLEGEIVSCDSMQIYRGMDIGTAKPDMEEREGIPHWMLDIADPMDARGYSCADYVKDAGAAVKDILSRGKLPIFCGGTGLYLDAFLRGGTFEVTDTDPVMRAQWQAIADREGPLALHTMLAMVDPESAQGIHPHNVKRVIRALEIYHTSGKTKSEWDRLSRQAESPWDACVIGLRYEDRAVLYDRIHRRVDAMMAAGLVEETRRLRAAGVFEVCATAAQAIGYKELFAYLDGAQCLEEAVAAIQMATRRYAKRQMTWFSAKPYVQWLDVQGEMEKQEFENIVNNAEKLFSAT